MMGLYSIRMRGAEGGPHEEGGRHISGAERIVCLLYTYPSPRD